MNMRKNWYSQRGVTLIELMIVIGIIGILVAIAYPSYVNQVRESRRAEAHRALMGAAAELEKLYGRQGSYANAVFGPPAPNSGTFPVGPSNSRDANGGAGAYALTFNSQSASGYRITATPIAGGPQAKDTTCSTISYDSSGQRYANGSVDTTGTCW